MKIITLRIDEEEKARLEQLAERGNLTLSRALREGAALYLNDLHGKLHAARGGRTTLHGVRRDRQGVPVTPPTEATRKERALLSSLQAALIEGGLVPIRAAWLEDADSRVVLGALAHWLSVVGELYGHDDGFLGWSWFVRDYCPGYTDAEDRERLRAVVMGGAFGQSNVDLGPIFDALTAGTERLLVDAEHQELVRRSVLPAWSVMGRSLS